MAKIYSRWKLTLSPASAPLVILNYDELLAEELKISLVKGLEVVQLTDADFPFLRPTGNAYYQLEFTVYRHAADDDDARVAMLNYLTDTIDTRGKQPLKLEIYGRTDRYYEFASSFTTTFRPLREIDSNKARYGFSFTLTATALTKVLV